MRQECHDLPNSASNGYDGNARQNAKSVVKLATENSVKEIKFPIIKGSAQAGQNTTPIVCNKTFLPDQLLEAEYATFSVSTLAISVHLAVPIMPTAKPKARQARQSVNPAREQRRVQKNRLANFHAALQFAYKMDWPINVALTVTWSALINAGSHNEGHCLAMAEAERDAYLRKELGRCLRKLPGSPKLVAIWGRDVGRRMGSHIHVGIFWPRFQLTNLVKLLERITGSEADPPPKERTLGYYSSSGCGGWLVKHIHFEIEGARRWIDYIAGQDQKHPNRVKIEGKAFGVSQSIGPAARRLGAHR
ncbi:MAG: hypothetical protein V4586_13790 [Pseudomonadota bacterium]